MAAKAARRTSKKPVKKRAKKARAGKPTKRPVHRSGLTVQVPASLEARLKMLATNLGKNLDEVIAQALNEFAETWENHVRTVAALKDGEDRVQLSVPKE